MAHRDFGKQAGSEGRKYSGFFDAPTLNTDEDHSIAWGPENSWKVYNAPFTFYGDIEEEEVPIGSREANITQLAWLATRLPTI